MKRCETCTNCSIYQGDEQPDNSSFIYCTKGHFEDYPESFFNDPVDYFRDCKDYSVDFQFTWRGPLIVHYRRTKDGGIEVSSLTDCNGLLPDIDIVNAVMRQCQIDNKTVSQAQREIDQYNHWNTPEPRTPKPEKISPEEKPCIIYLMQDTARGFYKIGMTKNIHTRLKALKTANAAIEVTAHYKGVLSDEKHLHATFEGVRVSGEWFSLTEMHLAEIEHYFSQKSE